MTRSAAAFRNRLRVLIGATAVAAISGCTPIDTTRQQTGHTPSWSATSTATPAPTVAPPTPGDFVVGVIVTEQKCFGSAGCNYLYTDNPQYVSANPLPPKTTVIFTVAGGEQDQVGNFTIDADGMATFDREASISGPEGAELRTTVTQVIHGR
ncbi:hypothetical protein [Mycolicibacterium tusciae]|uniref:hypothetical protein n=1 Tax=Mycolicibacterium tusciae TaxID=75922 RepID=UPI00024A22FB|nr:hypothetical protein [Mycolicibacterium tusciae]